MKVTSTNETNRDRPRSKYRGRKVWDADYKVERTFSDILQDDIERVREVQRKIDKKRSR